MRWIALKIEGVHCDGCAATIKAPVEREPGVRMVTVDFRDDEARILYDPAQVSEARLIAAIERPGYCVTGHRP